MTEPVIRSTSARRGPRPLNLPGGGSPAGCSGVCLGACCLLLVPIAAGAGIDEYRLIREFTLPASIGPVETLADGRLIALSDSSITIETGVGSGAFTPVGDLSGFAPSFGPSFLEVSASGTRAVAGSNGDGYVTVFDIASGEPDVSSATNFGVPDFTAAWIDDTRVAITSFGAVDVLDVTTGIVRTVISGVGGGSGGIAFDADGRLFTGNGFDTAPGGSETGTIKAFDAVAWRAALEGGPAIDFESGGTIIADLLSASSLEFDAAGNLFVGGGDFFGGSGDLGYAAIVDAGFIAERLADPAGTMIADAASPGEIVRQIQSPQDAIDAFVAPSWTINEATGEALLRYGERVLVYRVPSPGAVLLVWTLAAVSCGRRRSGAEA